ncbi:MAG: sugar phosphate isomerase/epimerase [Terracidiphilus sp.]|jgi:sugar phosphate isomerase/epimerase
MISISCADYAFPLLPREQRFALLRLLGFEYVDLGLFERSEGLRPGQLLAEPRKFARQLKRDLIHAGLRASDVFLQTGVTLEDAAENNPSGIVRAQHRKTFILILELCADLECTHVTGLPGVLHKDVGDKASFELAVEEMGWRQRVASSAGICYAIKPHVDSICSDVEQAHKLLDAVPDLSLTLDYGHFVFQRISSRHVHNLLPYASHVHMRGSTPQRLQLPLHESSIDFQGIIRRLFKNRYPGFLAITYLREVWNKCDRTDNVSETILLRKQLMESLPPEPAKTNQAEARSAASLVRGTWPQSSPAT